MFKGIHLDKRCNSWQARIYINKKQTSIGYFESEIQAALAYDNAAIKYFGEFANLNFREV